MVACVISHIMGFGMTSREYPSLSDFTCASWAPQIPSLEPLNKKIIRELELTATGYSNAGFTL